MAKEKMTVTIAPDVFSDVDKDAREAGMNRSEYVERALRNEHYRRLLARVGSPAPISAGDEKQLRDLLVWQRNPGGDQPAAPAS